MEKIIIPVAAVIIVVLVIALIAVSRKKKTAAKGNGKTVEPVEIIDGVRYSKSEVIEENGEQRITLRPTDVYLAKGKTYTAERGGKLMPGRYDVLSAVEGVDRINVRCGAFVTELRHGQELILGEGESICPVSHPIILR